MTVVSTFLFIRINAFIGNNAAIQKMKIQKIGRTKNDPPNDFANKIIKMLQLPDEFKDDHKHWPVVRHTTGALECLVCHKMLEEGKNDKGISKKD